MSKIKLPLGFKANGIACGIKQSGKPDLGLILSDQPALAWGLFTTNRITSGSVRFCQENLKRSGRFKAIIVNSGNANCWNGESSFKKAGRVAGELARLMGISQSEILLASTGIIGKPFPEKRIKQALPILIGGLSKSRLINTAKAIMTTDTFIKLSSVRLSIGKRVVTICGLAKGAGMIAPRLSAKKATMLCFILSDADISQAGLRKALGLAVDSSFNCITVDGCMSTNDTLLMMSNSCANNQKIKPGSRDFSKFCSGLNQVCLSLAKMIVQDAEGASKFIEIKISQAGTYQEARQVALSIANSNLFKTAMFGKSRNLGRIIAAIGASGVDVKEKDLRIGVSSLNKKTVFVSAELKRGNCQAIVYTSDLTPEYVRINAEYS
ncbi:MAG: bifunctional glutamate N-acetyltransferase/amino-acid acetyltransferase ArgJ [Candidatus Omnitrophota bacterium]|jgi:glutamate N-acetyltransferase/amino-acid N-acetyltransferase